MTTTAIDCTPTWRSLVPIFLTVARQGNPEGVHNTIAEIARISSPEEAQRIVMGLRQDLLPQKQFEEALTKVCLAADRRNRDDYERDNDIGS